jgi:exodeoxyribonuclease VII small subunit
MAKKEKAPTYDAMIDRLQEIVDEMDADMTSLEQSIHLYDEGITLIERCVAELHSAEHRLKELRQRADGLFELVNREDPQ